MPPVPVWPAELPQVPLSTTYQETAPTLAIRSSLEGPSQMRRRTTAGVRPCQIQVVCTFAQIQIVQSFHRDVCALVWAWHHFLREQTAHFRFQSPPEYRPVETYERWFVRLDVEVLPPWTNVIVPPTV
jgi:hypothetical protein